MNIWPMYEFYYNCELCQKTFLANSDAMLQCKIEFEVRDETGKWNTPNDTEITDIVDIVSGSQFMPFLKGSICICPECWDRFVKGSLEVIKEEGVSD